MAQSSFAFLWVPFVITLILSGIHVYLGLHVLSRGIIFVDLALAQVAALGTTLAVLADYEVGSPLSYALALSFTILGAVIFSATRRLSTTLPQEALIGIVYVVSSAAMILVLDRAPHGAEHVMALLARDILWVQEWSEAAKLALIYGAIGVFHYAFRTRFYRATFSPQSAKPAELFFWDLLFYITFGIVVTSSVQIAGVLMVFTYLIVPAVGAALFSRTIFGRLVFGWAFAFISSVVGLLLSYYRDLPTGPTLIVTFGFLLVITGGLGPIFSLRVRGSS